MVTLTEAFEEDGCTNVINEEIRKASDNDGYCDKVSISTEAVTDREPT